MKRWHGLALRLLFAAVLCVGALELGLRFLTKDQEGHQTLFGLKLLPFERLTAAHAERLGREGTDYIIPDSRLGWTIRPNTTSADGLFTSDGLGLRSASATVASLPPAAPVVLLAGDSFTHGDELRWEDTWCAQLQHSLGEGFTVRNVGVPGYGTDQALLRAEALLPQLQPRKAVLALCRDDLLRNVNLVRSYYLHWTDFPWTKPRFVVREGRAELVNCPTVPVAQVAALVSGYDASPLAALDRCYRPGFYTEPWSDSFRLLRYLRAKREHRERHEALQGLCAESGEAVTVTTAIAQRFCVSMRAAGADPLILLLPQADDLPRYRSGTASVFAPLMAALSQGAVPFIDAGPALAADLSKDEDVAVLYVGGSGHPNRRACARIAALVHDSVRAPR